MKKFHDIELVPSEHEIMVKLEKKIGTFNIPQSPQKRARDPFFRAKDGYITWLLTQYFREGVGANR